MGYEQLTPVVWGWPRMDRSRMRQRRRRGFAGSEPERRWACDGVRTSCDSIVVTRCSLKVMSLEFGLEWMLLKVAKLLKVVAADTGGSDGCSGVVLEPWILLQLDEYLQRARCIVVDGDASSLLPRHAHGKFLRMFLGPINVRASRKDVQLKDYKYVRILGAFYLQLTGSDTDVYHYLEPLYNDYRKLRRKLADGRCGFQTKQKYRFGWFSMKLKLVGGDSAGVVTAYYMCSENGAGPTRDEIDFEFLGNRTGQPYLIQTNVYKNGTGNREMRHMLWFDPTEDYHTYSILWNNHQLVFFVDRVPIRVFKNNEKPNDFFPNEKPMYLFSSVWNADEWATRGGLEKTNWKLAPFVSSYKDFSVDACQWEDPYPKCVSTTTKNWWDQYDAWHLSGDQKMDYAWVQRNLVIYDYCNDSERFPTLPEECSLSPWE